MPWCRSSRHSPRRGDPHVRRLGQARRSTTRSSESVDLGKLQRSKCLAEALLLRSSRGTDHARRLPPALFSSTRWIRPRPRPPQVQPRNPEGPPVSPEPARGDHGAKLLRIATMVRSCWRTRNQGVSSNRADGSGSNQIYERAIGEARGRCCRPTATGEALSLAPRRCRACHQRRGPRRPGPARRVAPGLFHGIRPRTVLATDGGPSAVRAASARKLPRSSDPQAPGADQSRGRTWQRDQTSTQPPTPWLQSRSRPLPAIRWAT